MKAFYTFLACLLLQPLWGQVAVINEFASDATNFDGQGGDFIELYCPAGGGACNIGCWAISDGQGVLTIPSGTTIPAGGFYLIAYAPSFNCDSCDFAGLTVDLDMATCNCLNGGSYSAAPNGQSIMALGQGGNAGEMLYLYNQNGLEVETWKFDNASAASMPMGGTILSSASNGCAAKLIDVTDPTNSRVVNVGPRCLGCNTSYTRTADGGSVWTTDDHPTPRASNSLRGTASFSYQYSLDGGAWQTISPSLISGNTQTASVSTCVGSTVQFRTVIRNYQNPLTTQYNLLGQIGSYFLSAQTGRIDWPTVQGLSALDGELSYLVSPVLALPVGNSSYTLQWADFNRALGGSSPTSANECYERLNISLSRRQSISSASVACTDPFAGISTVSTNPSGLQGVTYQLYDDGGNRSNLVQSNSSGLFQLPTSAAPTVGYYVVASGQCNTVTVTTAPLAFCRASPLCPTFSTDTLKINGVTCASPCNACPADALSLFADGNNLPGGGNIRWFMSETPNFNPYNGEGDSIAQVNIPSLYACSSPSPRLNEVLYRPSSSNNGSPDGSYIELIAPAGTNIGCYIITDGDWTVTIPPNTTVPADGIFSIGNSSVPAYAGISFDLNVATCACTRDTNLFGSNLLNLTDLGEYVAFFNNSGTFIDGLSWGTPTAGNVVGTGVRTFSNIITTRAMAGCPTSVVIPTTGYTNHSGGVAVGVSVANVPDGSGTWSADTASFNRCNDSPNPIPMPSATYSLPASACNKTVYIKGIITPHPNTAACPNSNSSAFTREYQLVISCPSASLTSASVAVCNNNLPVVLPIQTNGIADGSAVSVLFTRNGVSQSTSSSVTGGVANISVTQTGSYQLSSVSSAGLCPAATSGSASVQVIAVPNSPNVPSAVTGCTGETKVVSASGAATYEWSYQSNFATIAATGTDFTATVPSTVFVRAINDNPAAPPAVSCVGAPKSITVNGVVCPDITYPLSWLDFHAEAVDKDKVKLIWATATELNTDYFGVEHSTDGVRFERIGQQPAAGQSSQRTDYQFIHPTPAQGWNYYQLQQVDIDGSSSYSRKAAVYFDDEKAYFSIFPNPVQNEELHLAFFSKVLRNSQVMVYNQLGQLLYQSDLDDSQTDFYIPLQNWAAGTYTLVIKDNLRSYQQKFHKY